jgi:hypothetical protein
MAFTDRLAWVPAFAGMTELFVVIVVADIERGS